MTNVQEFKHGASMANVSLLKRLKLTSLGDADTPDLRVRKHKTCKLCIIVEMVAWQQHVVGCLDTVWHARINTADMPAQIQHGHVC